jgi:hypothetical protein
VSLPSCPRSSDLATTHSALITRPGESFVRLEAHPARVKQHQESQSLLLVFLPLRPIELRRSTSPRSPSEAEEREEKKREKNAPLKLDRLRRIALVLIHLVLSLFVRERRKKEKRKKKRRFGESERARGGKERSSLSSTVCAAAASNRRRRRGEQKNSRHRFPEQSVRRFIISPCPTREQAIVEARTGDIRLSEERERAWYGRTGTATCSSPCAGIARSGVDERRGQQW